MWFVNYMYIYMQGQWGADRTILPPQGYGQRVCAATCMENVGVRFTAACRRIHGLEEASLVESTLCPAVGSSLQILVGRQIGSV
jgi:hypothetical protein